MTILGFTQSRRDEMISIGYVLVYLLRGKSRVVILNCKLMHNECYGCRKFTLARCSDEPRNDHFDV